jgi:hypothetical protein
MANINRPTGLSPVRNGDGSPWNQQVSTYVIPAADLVAYYIGDLVSSAAGADAQGIPYVVKTAANGVPRGVIVGIDPVTPSTSLQGVPLALETLNVPATKLRDYYVFIAEDPNMVMEAQFDAVTVGNLVAANVNKNCDFVVGVPTGIGNQSGTVLSSATVAVTTTLPLKIAGLVQREDNTFGAYQRVYVRFNKHELYGNTAGV